MAAMGIAYFPIFGKPLIMYLGIMTLFFLMATAAVAKLNAWGYRSIPFVWHHRLAAVSIALAVIHGILGVLVYI